MSKWYFALFAVLAAFSVVVIMAVQDDSPPATFEDIQAAEEEWDGFDEATRNIICNIWIDHTLSEDDEYTMLEAMNEGESLGDSGLAKAKIDIMERECDELL